MYRITEINLFTFDFYHDWDRTCKSADHTAWWRALTNLATHGVISEPFLAQNKPAHSGRRGGKKSK